MRSAPCSDFGTSGQGQQAPPLEGCIRADWQIRHSQRADCADLLKRSINWAPNQRHLNHAVNYDFLARIS
jgi:hypothetical protein